MHRSAFYYLTRQKAHRSRLSVGRRHHEFSKWFPFPPGCQLVDVTMNSPSPNGFLFLLRSCSLPQNKYFNSPKFSLLLILLSSSPQCTKYFPSPNFCPPFPSLVFSSSSMGTKYFLFQIISSPSFSVLLLLFYCQHLHNKNWNDNKIFALVTWPSLDIFSCPGQLNR